MWQDHPFEVKVEAGKSVALCMCGNTGNPPYCDGSHKGSEFSPEVVRYDKAKTLWVCGCGKSGVRPFCDGTHKK